MSDLAESLRKARLQAGLSQAELAKLLELSSQAQVSRYESDPGKIPFELVQRWFQNCNTALELPLSAPVAKSTVAAATGKAKRSPSRAQAAALHSQGLRPGKPYHDLHMELSALEQWITSHETTANESEPLLKQMRLWKRKPTMIIAGKYDSGKSRLANALLGYDALPTRYTPTTKIPAFIRHTSSRPHWQSENVLVMRKGFDPSLWWSKDHVLGDSGEAGEVNGVAQERAGRVEEGKILKQGSYELLKMYGIHRPDRIFQIDEVPESALVYVDSELLNACDLIDIPGKANDEEDEKAADRTLNLADILLYTSPAVGFLDPIDLAYLCTLLQFLPAPEIFDNRFPVLGNLFIVITHAAGHIDKTALELIRTVGSNRLYTAIRERGIVETLLQRTGHLITQQDICDRIFTFWDELPERRRSLENELTETLSVFMPAAVQKQLNRQILDAKSAALGFLEEQIKFYNDVLRDIDEVRRQMERVADEEISWQEKVGDKYEAVLKEVSRSREAIDEFLQTDVAMVISSVDAVETFIRVSFKSESNPRAEAKVYALQRLQERIQRMIEEKQQKLSQSFSVLIEDYLAAFTLPYKKQIGAQSALSVPFDARGAFIGGLAGLSAVGALGLWAGSLGNLAGYVVVAKIVGMLSVFGVSVGTGTVSAFVAAIGGPISLGIGVGILVGWAVWSLTGQSWERRLAKKIVTALTERNLLTKLRDACSAYWDASEVAFIAGADAAKQAYEAQKKDFEAKLRGTGSAEYIVSRLAEMERSREFYAELPTPFASSIETEGATAISGQQILGVKDCPTSDHVPVS